MKINTTYTQKVKQHFATSKIIHQIKLKIIYNIMRNNQSNPLQLEKRIILQLDNSKRKSYI